MYSWLRFASAMVVGAVSSCNGGGSAAELAGDADRSSADSATVAAIRVAARPLSGSATEYDTLMALVGAARVVFLGEQTHGTHEFYRERADITKRLIQERGFRAIALEADWYEAERMNRYVHGEGKDRTAEEALRAVSDFPLWMWRNTDVRDLVEWVKTFNAGQPADRRVSFFGLDVYGLYSSIDAVLEYYDAVDPAAAARARTQYECFAKYRPNAQAYGAAASGSSCQAQAGAVLAEMRQRPAAPAGDVAAANALFAATGNAQSVVNAEEYFRSLYTRGVSTWNVRDQRMDEGVAAIDRFLSTGAAQPARMVVWAHNTHAGDARATETGEAGEHNVGQLLRQRLGQEAVLVGFFTHRGTVMAAPEWDQPGRVYEVRPALPGSYSDLFHAANPGSFLLPLRGSPAAPSLSTSRLERAIGVIYVPATERQSHYFFAKLAQQFDAVVFLDVTSAVSPL